MKLPILTTAILALLTASALAQDAPAPEMPADMEPHPTLQTASRRVETAPKLAPQKRVLKYTMREGGVPMCGDLVRQDRTHFHVRVNGGEIQRVAIRNLTQHKIALTCTSPPSSAETPKPTFDPPALQLSPPRMRYTKSRIPGDWAIMALGGGLMSTAGGVAGGLLGYTLAQGCDDLLCGLGHLIIGAGAGSILGGSAAVTVLGHSFGRNGTFVAATIGGLLGGGLSAAMSTPLDNPVATMISIPLGTGIGATMMYLLSDDSSTMAVMPTQGGAYATYGFAF